MATHNLYLVTQALTRLLDLNVRALLTRHGFAPTVNVTAMPPEKVGSETNTLNLHLYHASEAADHRNAISPGTGGVPVARAPLALSLYYILTAHHQVNDVFDAETQQLLFGLAMKSFHDHPTITDSLMIAPGVGAPQQVMPAGLAGRDNAFNLALRPLTPEEALTFWHADDSATTRLSAYYEVRPVFLEPEPPTNASGLVFDVGIYLAIGQAPRIDASSALIAFTPPPASGMPEQAMMQSPARATLATALPGLPVNVIHLTGTRLNGGGGEVTARLMLSCPDWQALTPSLRSVEVDAALNPAWAVTLGAGEASFAFQETVIVAQSGGPNLVLQVAPGFYTVWIELERTRPLPNGESAFVRSDSNRTIISLGPRLAAADPPNGAGRIAVHVVPLFDITDPANDVQLAVDGLLYTEVAAFAGNAAADAGHFRRVADGVEFHPVFAPAAGSAHPVRLVVNGAESQPFWAVLP